MRACARACAFNTRTDRHSCRVISPRHLSPQVSYDRCIEGVKCAKFAGESYLSVDSLANAFHSWQTFSISFWIWPDHRGTMGLFTNGLETGACSSLPTVAMTTTNEQLNGRVAFKDKVAIVKGRVRLSGSASSGFTQPKQFLNIGFQ